MTQIIVVAGLTLSASFLCSLLEAALYSLTPSQVAVLRDRGAPGAKRLVRIREDIEEPIAAILTINTIAHTVGAAWCGALVAAEFGNTAVGVFAAVFTLLVLALTEIVPKSLGVRYATFLGTAIAWPITGMVWSTYPVVWVAKHAMRRLTGGAAHAGPSEDEVVATSQLAAQRGAVRAEEQRWVQNALRLDRVTARALRTPRTVVESVDADTSVAELARDVGRWVHSRVPVTEGGDPDRVVGLAHRREVLDAALREPDAPFRVRDLMRPIRFEPESTPAHELLQHFLEERDHLAAVVDEYGGFDGVVTLEDVLEQLIGAEIVDEHDRVDDMQALALERMREREQDDEPEGERNP